MSGGPPEAEGVRPGYRDGCERWEGEVAVVVAVVQEAAKMGPSCLRIDSPDRQARAHVVK